MAWLFADDFVEIHPGGEIVDKKQQIDQIMDPTRSIEEIHPDDIDVRYTSPDVAVLLDTTTIRGFSGGVKYDGKHKVDSCFRETTGPMAGGRGGHRSNHAVIAEFSRRALRIPAHALRHAVPQRLRKNEPPSDLS